MARYRLYRNSDAIILFLIGLFSLTQVRLMGKIGISELVMVCIAPFMFLKNMSFYRREGVMGFLILCVLWLGGAIVSDLTNGSVVGQMARGISVPVVIFCTVVCIYPLLSRDIRNIKWLLLGISCSMVLSTFVFQRGSAGDLAAQGDASAAIERVVGYKLFWFNMANSWLSLPIEGWYLITPTAYLFFVPLGLAVLGLFIGGRSSFLVMTLSWLLIFIARKNFRTMKVFRSHIVLILMVLGAAVIGVKVVYKYCVVHGYMGEEERTKYESQTRQGESAMKLLMAGRIEFFIALFAALDKPFLGHGSWALDKDGYNQDFVMEYGTEEDIRAFQWGMQMGRGIAIIRTHSHIITYWMWHGIFGLLFWAYIAFLAFTTLFKRMHLVPGLFGYLAMLLPTFCWDVLFSPFGLRINECLLFCVFIYLRHVESSMNRKRPYMISAMSNLEG